MLSHAIEIARMKNEGNVLFAQRSRGGFACLAIAQAHVEHRASDLMVRYGAVRLGIVHRDDGASASLWRRIAGLAWQR